METGFALLKLLLMQELKKHNVKDVVRVCEPTYKVEELRKEGIDVTDLVFDDGTFPPGDIVDQWFDLLRRRWGTFFSPKSQILIGFGEPVDPVDLEVYDPHFQGQGQRKGRNVGCWMVEVNVIVIHLENSLVSHFCWIEIVSLWKRIQCEYWNCHLGKGD